MVPITAGYERPRQSHEKSGVLSSLSACARVYGSFEHMLVLCSASVLETLE